MRLGLTTARNLWASLKAPVGVDGKWGLHDAEDMRLAVESRPWRHRLYSQTWRPRCHSLALIASLAFIKPTNPLPTSPTSNIHSQKYIPPELPHSPTVLEPRTSSPPSFPISIQSCGVTFKQEIIRQGLQLLDEDEAVLNLKVESSDLRYFASGLRHWMADRQVASHWPEHAIEQPARTMAPRVTWPNTPLSRPVYPRLSTIIWCGIWKLVNGMLSKHCIQDGILCTLAVCTRHRSTEGKKASRWTQYLHDVHRRLAISDKTVQGFTSEGSRYSLLPRESKIAMILLNEVFWWRLLETFFFFCIFWGNSFALNSSYESVSTTEEGVIFNASFTNRLNAKSNITLRDLGAFFLRFLKIETAVAVCPFCYFHSEGARCFRNWRW